MQVDFSGIKLDIPRTNFGLLLLLDLAINSRVMTTKADGRRFRLPVQRKEGGGKEPF